MRAIFLQSIRFLMLMILLTGVLYPLAITFLGQSFFKDKANGSVINIDNLAVGSELLAQKFLSQDSFWSRPSNSDYQSVPSGASNLGPTSKKLSDKIIEARKLYPSNLNVPYDLLLSSGSGLDPHISPEAARFQLARISSKSALSIEVLENLIEQHIELPTWGILGRPRVNVLNLNLALKALRK